MLENIRRSGHEADLDENLLPAIAEHCRRVAAQEGFAVGRPNEYSVFPYRHQMPGGMTGTLRAQLAQYGIPDRLDEVLEEIVRVREDLGHPISATPFSQLMGIQAVLNVVTGRRYSVVPDEVIVYTLGHLGEPPCPIDENAKDAILSTQRGRELLDWEPPQPSLEELRREYGGVHISDEELILRYLVPLEDFQAAMAAGPVVPHYEFHEGPAKLVRHLLSLTGPTYLHVDRDGVAVTLRRGA
jgi:oxaloacetate decarboxylase alpha subunit